MAERILVADHKTRAGAKAAVPWGVATRYRIAGWVGMVLALAALSDYALAFYPLGFGSPEWEMSTIGGVVQGLPLFTIGLAGIWVGAGGLARRWTLRLVGFVSLVAAACLVGALVVFLTDVPVAIQATRDVARLGIYKLITKTLFLGSLFGTSYIVTGVLALRQARGSSSTEAVE